MAANDGHAARRRKGGVGRCLDARLVPRYDCAGAEDEPAAPTPGLTGGPGRGSTIEIPTESAPMSAFTIAETRRIPFDPATLRAIIADYHVAHPAVCPPKYFRNFQVLQGGIGAGTVVDFEMVVMGKVHPTRGEVSEPEPGRVIREWYPATKVDTTFTFEPRDGGRACDLTIATVMPGKGGLLGALERAFTVRFLRKVYVEELSRIEAYAASGKPVTTREPAPVAGR
jgi:hypothetical protein